MDYSTFMAMFWNGATIIGGHNILEAKLKILYILLVLQTESFEAVAMRTASMAVDPLIENIEAEMEGMTLLVSE